MKIPSLRPSQVKEGMRLDPSGDPKKHLEARYDKDGNELPKPTMLPVPIGQEQPYVCMVKEGAPHQHYTILGVDFMRSRFENVRGAPGQPPERRYIMHTHLLTPNQAEAVRIRSSELTDSGFTGEVRRNEEGVDVPLRVDNVPISEFLLFHPYKDAKTIESEHYHLAAENDALKAQLVEMERLRKEMEDLKNRVATGIPVPRKGNG